MKRSSLVVVLVGLLVSLMPSDSTADEIAHCWYEAGGNFGGAATLVCRIGGTDTIIDYVIIDPPPPLSPTVGRDSTGECWYNRTVFSGWRITREDGDSNAYMWYSSNDLSIGPWIVVGWIRRCDNEPTEIITVIDLIWDAVANFDFDQPEPVLQPETGVTGLPTYVDVAPPDRVIQTLVSPVTGDVVEVEFVVAAVVIDWGDGDLQEITPSLYALFGPYPDGRITHTYETKDSYDPSVEYQWSVRWRFAGGAWQTINGVAPTTWATPYQVDEIITRITG